MNCMLQSVKKHKNQVLDSKTHEITGNLIDDWNVWFQCRTCSTGSEWDDFFGFRGFQKHFNFSMQHHPKTLNFTRLRLGSFRSVENFSSGLGLKCLFLCENGYPQISRRPETVYESCFERVEKTWHCASTVLTWKMQNKHWWSGDSHLDRFE